MDGILVDGSDPAIPKMQLVMLLERPTLHAAPAKALQSTQTLPAKIAFG